MTHRDSKEPLLDVDFVTINQIGIDRHDADGRLCFLWSGPCLTKGPGSVGSCSEV